MKRCTVRTVQGIGDIFWVYQKLYPLFDQINFIILHTDNSHVSFRAKSFVEKWEKVKSVSYLKVTPTLYHHVMRQDYDLKQIIQSGELIFDYCCNNQLEKGVSLYNFDDLPVGKDLDILPTSIPDELPEKYILFYCSGGKDTNAVQAGWYWDTYKWLSLLHLFYEKYEITYPLVIIGAKYDEPILDEIKNAFKYPTVKYIDHPQEEVLGMMKRCEYFIGYQSGLNILADNYDVKQLMIYFPYLKPMQYTWCKDENKKTLFHADIFTTKPDQIIRELPNNILDMKQNKKKKIKISHGAGDVMASIPYIKAMGGEYLYIVKNIPTIPDWHPVNHGGAEMLIPFLRSQGLDGEVIDFSQTVSYKFDIDMDARERLGWNGAYGDIYTWNSLFFGVYPDMAKPFFEIEDVEKKDIIVFSRTARFNNPYINYSFLQDIKKKKIFIGTAGEVNYLKQCFPYLADFEHYQITDFLDAARLIKSAKLFISNQTSFAVLAEGLGVPRVLEICPSMPSVIPKTPYGRPVIAQEFFEKAVKELLNLPNTKK